MILPERIVIHLGGVDDYRTAYAEKFWGWEYLFDFGDALPHAVTSRFGERLIAFARFLKPPDSVERQQLDSFSIYHFQVYSMRGMR